MSSLSRCDSRSRGRPPPIHVEREDCLQDSVRVWGGDSLLNSEEEGVQELEVPTGVYQAGSELSPSSSTAIMSGAENSSNTSKSVTFDGDSTRTSYAVHQIPISAQPPSFGARPPMRSKRDDPYLASNMPASAHGQSASSGGAGSRGSNIPLPSPSAVHINNALEESLRRAEEERQRRSMERRQRRRLVRKREQQQQQQQQTSQQLETPKAEASTSLIQQPRPDATPAALPGAIQEESGEEDGAVESEEEDKSDEDYSDDSSDNGRNLTRQLAETAVSVREMSRELGRARVKSSIQSVLIVTKARDNQLIKLTREIALYLMKTPRHGRNRGIVVYVDAQLKKSKRFDAAGIERDNPELFVPDRPHHHGHHHSGSTSNHQRRNSRKSSHSGSASASSLNLLGMTAAHNAASSNHLTNGDGRSSAISSGASTPAHPTTQNGKPLTKLTEALVSRQLDRQLEKERLRRSGTNGTSAGASGAGTPGTPASARDGDDQQGLLRYWTAEMCSKSPHLFDLVVTLGGDGTVLFTSWLFQHVVPPVIPFALGSLGFLTNFDFSSYRRVMESAINDGVRVNLRMRFTATIYRAVGDDDEARRRVVRSGETGQIFMEKLRSGGWDAIESGGNQTQGSPSQNRTIRSSACRDRELTCSITRPAESFEVLNDLVVDRGPSPYVSLLELFGDEHHMTTVQADGLCVATPTGSTAYSLSAGGSLVHPEIPTLLITPICPHTLSFRPMLLPDSMELRICVPYNSRSTAWASFDGRGRVEIKQGDHIKVTASQYPFPTVCADKQSTDWFQAITRTLKWNERQRQKSFVVVEQARGEAHDPNESKKTAEKGYTDLSSALSASTGSAAVSATSPSAGGPKTTSGPDEEEDDGTFDIDDIPASPVGTPTPSAHNERQSSAPTINPSSSAAAQEGNGISPYSDSEHHDPRHLRQYDISTKSPRSNKSSRPAASRSLTQPPLPKHRSSPSRERAHSSVDKSDRVKAFVVFGADSSDAETSASEDA